MTSAQHLGGILPALVTPFTADGASIDEPALRALVSRLVAAGVGGLVPCGSTGEFTALSVEERKRVTELVAQAAAGAVPVVPQTGALTTKEAIELSKHAEGAGASAVMVVPPFYEPPGWAELVTHYEAVARAIGIPIMIYNIPSASGVRMSAEQVAELTSIPGVDYLKDTSGDAVLLAQLVHEYGDRVGIFNGLDTLTFCALAEGARGSVWGAANFIPELTVELYRVLAVDKDLDSGPGGLGQDLAYLPHPGEHELRRRREDRLRAGRGAGRTATSAGPAARRRRPQAAGRRAGESRAGRRLTGRHRSAVQKAASWRRAGHKLSRGPNFSGWSSRSSSALCTGRTLPGRCPDRQSRTPCNHRTASLCPPPRNS